MMKHRGIGCTFGQIPAGHNGEWRYEESPGTLTWKGFDLYRCHQHTAAAKIETRLDLDDPAMVFNDTSADR